MAEEIFGQLFTKHDADNQFGAVIASKDIESSKIAELFTRTESVLMFNILDDQIVIMGNGRTVLHPDSNTRVNDEIIFKVYSVSRLQELLQQGGHPITHVESRSEVLTLTNGNTTLELGGDCPPFC